MSYRTKQKEQIIDKIKSVNHEFSTKELYELLDKEIGLTTIYRLIDKMVLEEKIIKYIGDNNKTYYRYFESCDKDNHFYLKCDKCKSMTHIDCDCISELSNHIINEHKFNLKKENIVINGICSKCMKEGK